MAKKNQKWMRQGSSSHRHIRRLRIKGASKMAHKTWLSEVGRSRGLRLRTFVSYPNPRAQDCMLYVNGSLDSNVWRFTYMYMGIEINE